MGRVKIVGYTVRELAAQAGVPYYRVIYAERVGHIPPGSIVSGVKLWTPEDAALILDYFKAKAELKWRYKE